MATYSIWFENKTCRYHPKTLNVNVDNIISKVNSKTKVIMIINVLGYSSDLIKLKNFAKKEKLFSSKIIVSLLVQNIKIKI